MSDFDFSFSKPSQASAVQRNKAALRILVLGSYQGDQSQKSSLAMRTPRRVDIDTFDQTLSRLAPAASIPVENEHETVSFHSLEDFSPDALLANTPSLIKLARQRAAIKAGESPESADPAPESSPKDMADAGEESTDDTVSRLLGGQSGRAQAKTAGGLLDNFIRTLVEAESADSPDTSEAQLAGSDSAVAARLREILHAPSLTQLEANWRSLYELINVIEDDGRVEVALLPATPSELRDDLCRTDDEPSALVTTLVEQGAGTFGGQGWDWLVVTDPLTIADAGLVAALGAVAKAAGGRLLVNFPISAFAAEPPTGWQALRHYEAADAIHLVTPLVLMRPPYGSQHDAPDTLEFEECVGEPDFTELVWGSSAALVASCLAQAHQGNGDRGNLSNQLVAQHRPQYTFTKDGVKTMQPVAESLLSDSQAESLRSDWGVMPLRAERNGNRLLFVKAQPLSIA